MVHGRSGPKAYSVKFYDKILQLMPSLREVSLDIPPSFRENTAMKVTCEKNHQLVTKLTLKPSEDGQYQSMLNWCFLAFPNLKWLNIHDSSGLWSESIGRFEVILHKYTLEKLTIDMTPVKKKTMKHLEKQGSGEDFFVLEVESLASSERQLYKIPIDFSSSTSIKETDVKGFLLGEDYLRVNIIVRSVQVIELLMEKNEDKFLSSLRLSNVKRITLQIK